MIQEKYFWRTLLWVTLVYFLAYRVDVMDTDAAQYASMSREMLETGKYLEIYEQGNDYLDKPPLLFWLSSQSMRVFGATNFGYKFPSILFALLAIYATFRFARIYYNHATAQLAALILATSQAFFLITNDVRTDTILTGCVMFAIWQLAEAFESGHWRHFLWGFVGIGFGLLAKGPIALVLPAMGFSVHFLLKKQYKNFFRVEYLWGLGVIALILLPMCIGLYRQFDLHPEKVLYGRTGTSGLGFFFWTQSFGRITGSNVWNNNTPFHFLMLNMLWAFLPWTLLFFGGLIFSIKNLFRPLQNIDNQEFITLGGFILGYLSMGVSKYQLPHYLFVCYPFAAIMTAHFLHFILGENRRDPLSIFMQIGQWLLISLLWSVPFLVMYFVFPSYGIMFISMIIFGVIFIINAVQQKNIIFSSIYTALIINVFSNTFFYPKLLKYQLGSEVGKIISHEKVPENRFFTYKFGANSSLHFYAKRVVKIKNLEELAIGDWIVTNEEGLAEIQSKFNNLQYIETGNHFNVTLLNIDFLYEKTREKVVGQYFLVKILEDLTEESEPEEEIEPDDTVNE